MPLKPFLRYLWGENPRLFIFKSINLSQESAEIPRNLSEENPVKMSTEIGDFLENFPGKILNWEISGTVAGRNWRFSCDYFPEISGNPFRGISCNPFRGISRTPFWGISRNPFRGISRIKFREIYCNPFWGILITLSEEFLETNSGEQQEKMSTKFGNILGNFIRKVATPTFWKYIQLIKSDCFSYFWSYWSCRFLCFVF